MLSNNVKVNLKVLSPLSLAWVCKLTNLQCSAHIKMCVCESKMER